MTLEFKPDYMQISVLTAALQELTPRNQRDPDPDLAIEEWLAFASELGVDSIQLSAALHPTETDVPPEAMLDPVANTLDLRKPFDRSRAQRVEAAMRSGGIGISDIGYFDNLLHHDPARPAGDRRRSHVAADAHQHLLEARVVERPRDTGRRQPPGAHGDRQQLPIAAVAGQDQDRPARRPRRLDVLPPLDLHVREDLPRVPLQQVEQLGRVHPLAEEGLPGDPPPLLPGELGEGQGQVIEGAAAVPPAHGPG